MKAIMTNSNGRIDRIEALAEENERKISDLLTAITNQQQQINAVVALSQQIADSNQQQINVVAAAVQQTNSSLQQLTEQTSNEISRLAQIVESERARTDQILARQDQLIVSINAELDRQGRILDYLLGQQGQQPT